jgi:hypothetical protein
MPWLSETNGTPQSVALLLIEIQQLLNDCNQLLGNVSSHRARCATVMPNEPSHIDATGHGPDYGGTNRANCHTNLLKVHAALTAAKGQLGTASTEMSHNGMP